MGGLALKSVETMRCTRQEFDDISNEVITVLTSTFKHVDIPKFYKTKETFGDIDIVISTSNFKGDFREYIIQNFNPHEIFHNGNCWSFDFKEIQIDFITTSNDEFESMLNYMSWNDCSNMIGNIAHSLGLRFGQEGLWYEHEFKGSNLGKIHITKDMERILKLLDLNFKKWIEGFETLEDIFIFVSKSKYFNWKRFQLPELNKINRDRNKKRNSYISFLEWIDNNVADSEHEFISEKDKSIYLDLVKEIFPEVNIEREIRKLEYEKCKQLYIQSKFSGGIVMRKYGFKDKELGDILTWFKIWVIDYLCKYKKIFTSYEDFILISDDKDIKKYFEDYLKYQNIAIPS